MVLVKARRQQRATPREGFIEIGFSNSHTGRPQPAQCRLLLHIWRKRMAPDCAVSKSPGAELAVVRQELPEQSDFHYRGGGYYQPQQLRTSTISRHLRKWLLLDLLE